MTAPPGRTYDALRRRHLTVTIRSASRQAPVIELDRARDARRLVDLRRSTAEAIDRSRGALSRLFNTGAVFSRAGSRLGRELLLVHQQLLRAADLLSRLGDLRDSPPYEAEAVREEIQELLDRTGSLTARSEGVLARR